MRRVLISNETFPSPLDIVPFYLFPMNYFHRDWQLIITFFLLLSPFDYKILIFESLLKEMNVSHPIIIYKEFL